MPLSPDDQAHLARFAADHALDGILWVADDGRILYANEAVGRILGEHAAALSQRRFAEIAPEMTPELWRELWKEIRSRDAFAFEFSLLSGAQTERRSVAVEIVARRCAETAEEIAAFYVRDTQERKRLQALQQEFVSTVSHELRTPLTIIREGISQVSEGLRGEISESQRRALAIALTGIERLGRLIDELLDVSKIESGKIVLRRERINLSAVARDVTATFQSTAQDRGLDLRVSTPAGPVWVFADRDRLIQILQNLLSNAFKFTEKGRIEVSVAAVEDSAELAVADTGVGLTADESGRIFHKFEQLGRTAVTGEKGTGLGLSICKGLVELHEGRISVESDGSGRGSRFLVRLPRRSAVAVFRDQAAGLLEEVSKRGGSLSLVIMEVVSADESPVIEEEVDRLLEGLENLTRRHSGRRMDLVIKGDAAVYVALPSTVRREAERVAARILKSFEEAQAREGLARRLRMDCRIHSYPEDAAQATQFLSHALQEAA